MFSAQNVVGSGGGIAPNPNNNNAQNQQAITLRAPYQRVVPADLLRIDPVGGDSYPGISIGPGIAFLPLNAADQVCTTAQWQQIQEGQTTNSVPAHVVITLPAGSATLQLGGTPGHPALTPFYPVNTAEFQRRYGQPLWNFLQQYQGNLATVLPDVAHELGFHLAPDELNSLSLVNRHLFNSLAPRRQAITNATLLARGEATILRSGHVVRQNHTVMNQAQFDSALRYIQRLPPGQQREPLQELVRHATTQAQFEAVYDHLQNQGRLPHIPLPANFAALTPAVQRAVSIFSWRLSGHVQHDLRSQVLHNPPVPSTPQRRDRLLTGYANVLQTINGMAFPLRDLRNFLAVDNYALQSVLTTFGAPNGISLANAMAWLNRESQRGNLTLTVETFYRLSPEIQRSVISSVPNNGPERMQMVQANNYVNGTWLLHPTL